MNAMTEYQENKLTNCIEDLDNIISQLKPMKGTFSGIEKECVLSALESLERAYGQLEIMFER